MICILKVNFEHTDACSWWEGGTCDCQEEMRQAREAQHCRECNYVNAHSGETPCNCSSKCMYPNEEDHECDL